jgi:hypothetical protein
MPSGRASLRSTKNRQQSLSDPGSQRQIVLLAADNDHVDQRGRPDETKLGFEEIGRVKPAPDESGCRTRDGVGRASSITFVPQDRSTTGAPDMPGREAESIKKYLSAIGASSGSEAMLPFQIGSPGGRTPNGYPVGAVRRGESHAKRVAPTYRVGSPPNARQ